MTLHDKITELVSLGYDCKFHSETFFHLRSNVHLCLRFRGNGSTVIENRRMITSRQMKDEQFVISIFDKLYKEMKGHAYGGQHDLMENDGQD